jgi:FMN reductase (NADPH)
MTAAGRPPPRPEIIEAITGHRSIRRFRADPVDDATLDALIACAQAAPTSSHKQAYSVIRVDDSATRAILAEIAEEEEWLPIAPLVLVWCADLNRVRTVVHAAGQPAAYDNMEEFMVAVIDATLAATYAYVAAELIGLGGVLVGGLRNDPARVTEALRLPELVAPLFGMCLGFPDEDPQVKPRLPRPVVLHQDTYDPTGLVAEIAAYDDIVSSYYQERETNRRRTTWTSEMIRKFAQPERPHMRAFLESQGFRFD